MSKSKDNPAGISGPQQLNLINSSRLQALRKRSNDLVSEQHCQTATFDNKLQSREDAETAKLMQWVDQTLKDIMSRLPAGKQNRLFKIRFGMEIDEIKNLPPKRAVEILKIKSRQR